MTARNFDQSPFLLVRRDILDLVAIPLQSVMRNPAARKRIALYRRLYQIPLDLAAAGFTVEIKQTSKGWAIEVQRLVCAGSQLHIASEARSLMSALFQLADRGEIALTDLERAARSRLDVDVEGEAA